MAVERTCPVDVTCEMSCSRPEVGEVLGAVANPRCRHLLSVLDAHEGVQLTIESVLDEMGVIGEQERQHWYIALQHNHLPRLEEFGIVDWDRRASTVRYRGCPLVAEALELIGAA